MRNLKGGTYFPPNWPRTLGIVLDVIWQRRNYFVFHGTKWSHQEMVGKINKLQKEIIYTNNFQESVKTCNIAAGIALSVKWCLPRANTIHLNVDV